MKTLLSIFILLGTLSLNADNRFEIMSSEEYDRLILEKIDQLSNNLETMNIHLDRNIHELYSLLDKILYVFDHEIHETNSEGSSKLPSKAEMIQVTN